MELPEDRYDDLLLPPWSPDAKNLHSVGFDLLVEFPGGGGEVASPSHMLGVKMGEDASAHVRLANMEDVPNRDLVLDVKTETVAAKTFAGIDKSGQVQFISLIPSSAFGGTARCAGSGRSSWTGRPCQEHPSSRRTRPSAPVWPP